MVAEASLDDQDPAAGANALQKMEVHVSVYVCALHREKTAGKSACEEQTHCPRCGAGSVCGYVALSSSRYHWVGRRREMMGRPLDCLLSRECPQSPQ